MSLDYKLKTKEYIVDDNLMVVNILKKDDLIASLCFKKGSLEYSMVLDRQIFDVKKEKDYIKMLKGWIKK